MPLAIKREAWLFVRDDGTCPFEDWMDSLEDRTVQARVAVRVRQMEEGLFGDAKFLRDGVYEARIHFGAGWRIYYGLEGRNFIILLIGGAKSSQRHDIERAKSYWREYESTKAKRAR